MAYNAMCVGGPMDGLFISCLAPRKTFRLKNIIGPVTDFLGPFSTKEICCREATDTYKNGEFIYQMKEIEIENNFTYHAPSDQHQLDRYTDIRECGKMLAKIIYKSCPESREKSIAMTNLEQAVMWANASIARNE